MQRLSLLLVAAVATVALAGAAFAQPTRGEATQKNIVQVASGAKQYSTLVSLVKQAGLAGTLSAKGPYTVMAPTNAAFAKVPKATLAKLAKNKAALRQVLLYHVVPGRVDSTKVVAANGTSVATALKGKKIAIAVNGGTIRLNGSARVVKPFDVKASNGIIHTIDAVLIPAGLKL